MIAKSLPVSSFLEAVEKWLTALKSCDFELAQFQAHQIRAIGQLLAFDPEFKPIFLRNSMTCIDQPAEFSLECLYAFLGAVSEAACSGHYRVPASLHVDSPPDPASPPRPKAA